MLMIFDFNLGEPLGNWVSRYQIMFIKLMIEDRAFRNYVCIMLDRQFLELQFNPYELGDVVRVIREADEVTYDSVKNSLRPLYVGSESKEIGWFIIEAILEECEVSEENLVGWKNMLMEEFGAVANINYDDSKSWVRKGRQNCRAFHG